MNEHATTQPVAVQLVDRVTGLFSKLSFIAACVWLTVVMFWIVVDVTWRMVGVSGVTGTVAVAADSVVAISFLCIPFTVRNGGHIRSTILIGRAPRHVSRWLYSMSYLLGAAIFAFIAWSSWGPMWASWVTGEYTGEGGLRIPTAPFRTVVVVASSIMTLECLLVVDRAMRAGPARRQGEPDD